MLKILIFLIPFALAFSACEATVPTRAVLAPVPTFPPPPTPEITAVEPGQAPPPAPTASPTPLATATPIPTMAADPEFFITADPGTPTELVETARQVVLSAPDQFGFLESDANADADIRFTLEDGAPLASWTYAVAAPFATIAAETSQADMMAAWADGANSLGRLILAEDVAATLTALWGPPAAGVQIVPAADLVGAVWSARPAWTILPFQRLSPEYKVLRVDGQSPLDKSFDALTYPLVVNAGLSGESQGVARFQEAWPDLTTNRDPLKMTTVAMSGVTALGRATAYQMELQGITTPGVVVAPVMSAADIAHVSHEVSFAPDCPYPNPIGDPIFCARDSYLALIQSIGTDVVELTGNHVNDWGPENMARSVELYQGAGMKTFGGGRNLAEAREPAIFEHNGNRIAFVGCNPVGPAYDWATDVSAGSCPCNYAEFYEQIRGLKEAGYLVIATLQYAEYYQYAPTPQQQADFRAVAEAGAAAVSGSQGHHAQGFDFRNGSFIHYGLGNLFFDQMDMLGTRQSFIDTYTIYDGRLINVDLFTSLIENYCCPRTMSEAERTALLEAVFLASGW